MFKIGDVTVSKRKKGNIYMMSNFFDYNHGNNNYVDLILYCLIITY